MPKKEYGNWTDYRTRFGLQPQDEIDLHFGERIGQTYQEAMANVEQLVIERLKRAQANKPPFPYFMFIHGWSYVAARLDNRTFGCPTSYALKRSNALDRARGINSARDGVRRENSLDDAT